MHLASLSLKCERVEHVMLKLADLDHAFQNVVIKYSCSCEAILSTKFCLVLTFFHNPFHHECVWAEEVLCDLRHDRNISVLRSQVTC
jgi:hypothetical protein